ncbi:MAG TPA: hypothetical protein VMU38_11175 [Candidatus Binatia bacterium]|nr:hypothetical protein [Candidatus Binatia bacterium]
MRNKASAVAGALVALAALLTGCSSGRGVNALPPGLSSPGSPQAVSPVAGGVALWISSPQQNEIFGLGKDGTRVLTKIDGAANSCYSPNGIKVDHGGNLWVACYSNYPLSTCQGGSPGCEGLVQMYPSGSVQPVTYRPLKGSCAGNRRHEICSDTFAAPSDVALDASGNVFSVNATIGGCTEGSNWVSCGGNDSGSFSYWIVGKPIRPMRIAAIDNMQAASYLDADAAGNLYVSGSVSGTCVPPACATIVDEIAKPTSKSRVVTQIIGPTSDQLGGVYVSKNGSVLDVVDETARTISQYALPWVASETPFNVLGPTLEQMGKGEPIAGGFDKAEKHLAIGDADGWIDVGDVAGNRWSAVGKRDLKRGNAGAAYVPSDK